MAQTAPALRNFPRSSSESAFRLINRLYHDYAEEHEDLVEGLRASPAKIAPKYLYDALGCALFEAICELPEYYPTRTERSIYRDFRGEIVRALGTRKQFVDLGAGDCAKAELLLPSLDARRYLAIDIAPEALRPALIRLAAALPDTELVGIATDFSQRLDLAGTLDAGPANFFYPGSSIGNFAPAEARHFLGQVRRLCTIGGGLLIGIDTKKDVERLRAAYDDAVGVTAAFNRNILQHVNVLVGGDFVASDFDHVALYDESLGRIEMHLEARRNMSVSIAGKVRAFAKGERIHTESSYKYAPEEFAALLAASGFVTTHRWQDPAGDFAVFYAQ